MDERDGASIERRNLEIAVIEAAKAWVEAQRAWEATANALERPPDLSRIKGRARRAERDLMDCVDALVAAEGGSLTANARE